MDASLGSVVVAALSALLMALALPKTNASPLVFVGALGLFWTWFRSSPRRAFLIGFWAGIVYFSLTFSWFSETAGHYIAPFGMLLVLAPACIEAVAFAACGALASLAWRRAAKPVAPLAAAAAFAACEWLRSIGPLGLPFGNLSYTQVESPFAPLAAFVGSFGVTFTICVVAAYLAGTARAPVRAEMVRAALIALSFVLIALVFAWSAWPARHAPSRTLRVAAIQGNISQDVKWTRAAFETARARYAFLTTAAARAHPALILWPETVMTLDLNLAPDVVRGISSLARASHATLMVGAKQSTPQGEYNALYVFTSDGRLAGVYRKRRLVPFVETLPAPWLFGRIPVAAFISRFRPGETSGVVPIDGLPIAPLICWESAFDGEAHAAIRDGARAFALSTDDAWFGSTAGPYQHAQIAQMRALESGVWVLRAAATGISGIIAPSGRYVTRAPLNTMRVVAGAIGPPQLTPYARLGPVPVALALIALYAALVLRPRRAT